MSLVENLVNQISTNGLGGITKPQGFDMNDTTFEKLLQSMNQAEQKEQVSPLGNLGQPSGFIIEPFDQASSAQPVSATDTAQELSEPIQIKDVDFGKDYFSDLIKKAPKEHADILKVAQKHAAGAYKLFNKNLVEDLTDFASDLASMM